MGTSRAGQPKDRDLGMQKKVRPALGDAGRARARSGDGEGGT